MGNNFNNLAEPPGVFIREELEARGWSQRDLAYILGYSEQTVNKVISGKSGITAEMAKALGDAFGTSAEVWVGLQKDYELRLAREPDPAVKMRSGLQSVFPIREMIRRGWLEDSDQTLLEMQITRFFEVSSLAEVPQIQFAGSAKKTQYDNDPPEQIAWLFRVRQIARQINCPRYSESALKDALPKLRTLTLDPEDVRHVPGILHECGIRYVVSESLPSSRENKIDGVCTWINKQQSPVIGMSVFHDRIDNYWFVLRHEIEHVLRGHGKEKGILDNLEGKAMFDESNIDEQERVANAAALRFCFPREKIISFYNRKAPYVSERDVIGFSALMEVHPAIVVGQIQYMKDDYRWLRKYLVKVRKTLLESIPYDGWGEAFPSGL